MSGTEGDSFFSRWSRRKTQARGGEATVPDADAAASPPGPRQAEAPMPPEAGVPGAAGAPQAAAAALAAPAGPAMAGSVAGAADAQPPQSPSRPPPPTLADAEALTSESDFSRFVKPDVDHQVRNVALKRLFADPRFNVMDGLDTYIDDYNKPDPLPRSMLRQLLQARTLGLLDDELEEQPASAGHGDAAPAEGLAAPDLPEGADATAESPATELSVASTTTEVEPLPVAAGGSGDPGAAVPEPEPRAPDAGPAQGSA